MGGFISGKLLPFRKLILVNRFVLSILLFTGQPYARDFPYTLHLGCGIKTTNRVYIIDISGLLL